ncbi:MAG: hypothetical protein HFI75_09765 [Lachnospiraceae bacterium]|nr:hypothetical protein [Lachnospiraceae bacterium]
MELFDVLRGLGVDVDDGLKRINGNEKLYTRLLGIFVKTINTHSFTADFDGNDYAEETEKAHAIKGTAGNLSITPMYEAYTEIVNLLRADKPEEAREILVKVLPVQEEIVQCIEKHLG